MDPIRRPSPQGPPLREMDKVFDPARIEPAWRRFWDEKRLFTADPASPKPPFCMVIPPPNITGRLHVGHGLNNSLQDVLARWKRMSGFDVLWVPGSDHASIATHVMIERELEKEGLTRQQIGRERFLERARAWKEKYGGEIGQQLRRLGASCDWSRERFTMDEGLSRAVREVFVRLYEDGLIYRGRYLINWCPRCRTAVSDLEVVHRELAGTLWTVSYPLEGGGEIQVATTRPETILGDAAVAVHPDDERHRSLVGRTAVLPVLGRRIPVVADSFVDPAFGTGAVKVTPAHDPNDFEAARRLGLEPIVIMDESARMTDQAGPYAGLDRFECRARLLERLREEGRLVKEQDHLLSVGRCQRCDTIVEPYLSMQWFVRMAPLAGPALQAVESGRIGLVPDAWRKTYYEWMRNIRDWCISRQLWWGHRIPAWYCDDCRATIVSREDPSSCPACGGGRLTQDPDILDTWFSSGLWAFSVLGWPERTVELSRYYPTTVLVTGYDIIFFWVARMIMLGLRFTGEAPFHAVFFNGLVRDARGEKISKTKGNAIDFFDLLDRYGTDAVRFTYAALSAPGSDVSLAPGRLDGSRAFANKIWNAARFARPHLAAGPIPRIPKRDGLSVEDRWILSRSSRLAAQVDGALSSYRFDEASQAIYRFAWHELCDWYLEMIKPDLADPSSGSAARVRAVLSAVLDRLLRMLHPFMPFVTEEIWQSLPATAGAPVSIAVAPYPSRRPEWEDEEAETEVETLVELVQAVRAQRALLRVPPSALVPARVRGERSLQGRKDLLERLSRTRVEFTRELPSGGGLTRILTSRASAVLELHDFVDLPAEASRLRRELEKLDQELSIHEKKLANPEFVSRARPEALQKVKLAEQELTARRAEIQVALDTLTL